MAAQILVDEHAGQVPDSFHGLEALPGVGHKTASVIISQSFMQPALAVDAHVHRLGHAICPLCDHIIYPYASCSLLNFFLVDDRLATRWGLSCGRSVEQTEADLKALFLEEDWSDCSLRVSLHSSTAAVPSVPLS